MNGHLAMDGIFNANKLLIDHNVSLYIIYRKKTFGNTATNFHITEYQVVFFFFLGVTSTYLSYKQFLDLTGIYN